MARISQKRALLDLVERLRGAISWVEPPFVDRDTSDAEARIRIRFVLEDARQAERMYAVATQHRTPTQKDPHHGR